MTSRPHDNLIRSRYGADTVEMPAEGRTLHGHFSVFDSWTEINSRYEGRFMERVAPGAFAEAFANSRGIRVLYDHGADPSIGNKPIAAPTVMREDDMGAYYEAEMLDANYANELIPALRSGQLGASFRFIVKDDEVVHPRRATDHNPEALPERTIRNVGLYEFGPVTFGAYPDATSGVRSGTDAFYERLLTDPMFMARFTERVGLANVELLIAAAPDAVRVANVNPKDGQQANEGDPNRSALTRARVALAFADI